VLLATSGTAPANWLPAVIEASQAGVPLILLSADRPPELQGCGANQTIEQIGLFGNHVRASHALGVPEAGFAPAWLYRLAARIVEQSQWPHPGPVHINQPFREPLLPTSDTAPSEALPMLRIARPLLQADPAAIEQLVTAIAGQPGAIVCGELPPTTGMAEAMTALAAHLNCPLLAEPLSGLRFGAHDRSRVSSRYNRWLADPATAERLRPEWILRFGAFPVTRRLQDYVASATGVHALVEPWPRWSDPSHTLTHLLRADPLAACQALLAAAPAAGADDWLVAFMEQEQNATSDDSAWHIPALLAELPAGMPLFIGNSLAIRQLDSASGSGDKPLLFYGNRGASGIDGNISSALGIAAIHGRVVALLGDLTTQHDLSGLALAAGRDAIIVTINNGGGGIFDLLPQAGLPEFEQGWRTPQAINFQHAAATFGLGYVQAGDRVALGNTLRQALAEGGPWIIEVVLT
jgi:2-succinyl-5-enolpyruvyl-6-hydroxy-3-cyclohexene-1-carboxylate synthase